MLRDYRGQDIHVALNSRLLRGAYAFMRNTSFTLTRVYKQALRAYIAGRVDTVVISAAGNDDPSNFCDASDSQGFAALSRTYLDWLADRGVDWRAPSRADLRAYLARLASAGARWPASPSSAAAP